MAFGPDGTHPSKMRPRRDYTYESALRYIEQLERENTALADEVRRLREMAKAARRFLEGEIIDVDEHGVVHDPRAELRAALDRLEKQ